MLAATTAFVPLGLMLLMKHAEFEYNTGHSAFSELADICEKPCATEFPEYINKQVLNGTHYYYVNNNTCGYADVVLDKDQLAFLAHENGRDQDPIVYSYKRKENCFVHDEGYFTATMDIKSCKTMFINFACMPGKGVRIYVLFTSETLTDECFNRGYNELRKAGLILPKKTLKNCAKGASSGH